MFAMLTVVEHFDSCDAGCDATCTGGKILCRVSIANITDQQKAAQGHCATAHTGIECLNTVTLVWQQAA